MNFETIKKLAKKITIDKTAIDHARILTDAQAALQKSKKTNQAAPLPNIWRKIMNNTKLRKVKVAITAIVLMIVLGLIPFNGTTAFGKIANEIPTALERLKALISGQELPEAGHVERQIDKSVKICTTSRIYSTSDIASLESFLNEQNIRFMTAGSGNAKYAVIPPDKFADLRQFLRSSSIDVVSCLKVLTYAGQEAMLFTRDTRNTVGVAVTILQDENEQFILDFAFHNVEDGCELNGIKLANGEALLISGIKNGKNETSDDLMTILVLPEVKFRLNL